MAGADLVSGAHFHVRRALLVLAGAMVLLGSLPPELAAGAASLQAGRKIQLKTVVIPVEGMVCVACSATVKRALKSIDGVSNVEVSLEKRTAQVTYAPDKLSPDRLVAAINRAGYKAGTPKEVE